MEIARYFSVPDFLYDVQTEDGILRGIGQQIQKNLYYNKRRETFCFFPLFPLYKTLFIVAQYLPICTPFLSFHLRLKQQGSDITEHQRCGTAGCSCLEPSGKHTDESIFINCFFYTLHQGMSEAQ